MHVWKDGLGETMKDCSGESERFILAIMQGYLLASFCGLALLLTKDMLEKYEAIKSQAAAECLRISMKALRFQPKGEHNQSHKIMCESL